MLSDGTRDRALAAGGRPIDCNDEPLALSVSSSEILVQERRFDRAKSLWQGAAPNAAAVSRPPESDWSLTHMVKPEWGTKRTCPKCSTRFYDLGADDPVHCIECGTEWVPEPVLKSKQPMPFEAAAPVKEPAADADLEAEDLAIVEEEEPSADEEVDLQTGDDDLGVGKPGEDEES